MSHQNLNQRLMIVDHFDEIINEIDTKATRNPEETRNKLNKKRTNRKD
jgi:hypothetical protein